MCVERRAMGWYCTNLGQNRRLLGCDIYFFFGGALNRGKQRGVRCLEARCG